MAKKTYEEKLEDQFRVYRYTVRPFSGSRYYQNSRKNRSDRTELPCGICGKPTDTSTATHWAIVIDGGASWGDEASPQDSGHMGTWPIGNDCHRKYVEKS